VRVLVLPEHLDCCTRPIVKWIAKKLGTSTRVNIMFQYRPEWRAFEVPELRRRLTNAEMDDVLQIARDAGLENSMG
jgi:putative pyruvate formate lyase activating enzyme